MRLLVTGVSGFIGRTLARALVERGDGVTGLYVGPRPDLPGCELHELDIMQPGALRELARVTSYDRVIHLAALSQVSRSWRDPGLYFQINVLGTENVIDVFGGERVIVASSAEVYGDVPEEQQPLKEERTPEPGNPYALTKASAERLVLRAGGVVVRLFNIVGPGQEPVFALPSFAAQLATLKASGGRVLKVGNLAARRDFLHIEDAVAALKAVCDAGESGRIYNIGNGEAHSVGEVLDRLIAISGLDVELERDPERFRPLDIACLIADSGPLRALGWSPRRTLGEALEAIWREAQERSSRS